MIIASVSNAGYFTLIGSCIRTLILPKQLAKQLYAIIPNGLLIVQMFFNPILYTSLVAACAGDQRSLGPGGSGVDPMCPFVLGMITQAQ